MNVQFVLNLAVGFVGVIIGALIPISYEMFKTRKEKKKRLKSMIYILIDIHFSVSQIASIFNAANEVENTNKKFSDLIFQLADDERLKKVTSTDRITNLISDLSKIDPFLAQELDVYFMQNKMLESNFQKIFYGFSKNFGDVANFANNYLKTLEKFIYRLSKDIDVDTLNKSKKFTAENNGSPDDWRDRISVLSNSK